MAYCAKCGKGTKEGQIYCEDCLEEMEDNTFSDLFGSFDQQPELEDASDQSNEDDFTKILEELQGPREEIYDYNEEASKENTTSPSTVSDIFSDAISAISSLEDELEDMVDLKGFNENPEPQEKESFFARFFHKKKKSKKAEEDVKHSSLEQNHSKNIDKNALKKAKKEKAKLNKEEKAKLKLEKAKKAKQDKTVAKAKESAKTKESSKQAKSDKNESKKAAQSKAKQAEDKKEKAKQAALKKEKSKKVQQKETKAEKVAKKERRQKKKVEEFIVEEDYGHFNLGALIVVFGAFVVMTIYILLKVYTVPYQRSIEVASQKFENRKYNQAFEEIYGLEIKKDDQILYDKIMTVMYVNKQLNSYNNYKELDMYPEALDSLIKGLKRYDKYIDEASELGITNDLDYVRGQILKVLKREFGLSEKKAMKLTKIEDQTDYSIKIYDIVIENTDFAME